MYATFSAAQKRAIDAACTYADRSTLPDSGLVGSEYVVGPSERESFYAAIAFLLTGQPDRVDRARAIVSRLGILKDKFSIAAGLLTLHKADALLDEDFRRIVRESVRRFADTQAEDIIAGRNINLPLQTWTVRIAAGVLFKRPELVRSGTRALEQLTDLVAAHGTIPEFNSPTYHPVTLEMLRIIGLLGDPATRTLAANLERHLWNELAWRWHPRIRQLVGPWGRVYHDTFVGGSGNVMLLADMAWGAFYDEDVAYRYAHGHDLNYGGILALLAEGHPTDVRDIALKKRLPITVTAAAEQIDFRAGDVWVPGGVAELTTWMDENLSVGTATRSHVHGMQNGTYVAQWTRTGKTVEKLLDLGQAFTRFIQNGRRPGENVYHYRNHHRGTTMTIGASYWADDGRPFALQSGPTALVLYVPKGQERLYVRSLEAMMVIPRLDSIDAVLVDGLPVDEYEGPPSGAVVVRSGNAALGLRFSACDPELVSPRLIVERARDHLFVGLRLVQFTRERELPESEYRRYGASIGAELRYAPTEEAIATLVSDTQQADLTDRWWMGPEPVALGGPREVDFRIGCTRLYGRFAPVAERWLRRIVPTPAGDIHRIEWESATPTAD